MIISSLLLLQHSSNVIFLEKKTSSSPPHEKFGDEGSEDESYVGVEDEEILAKVFEIFKENFKDEFEFVDGDETYNSACLRMLLTMSCLPIQL